MATITELITIITTEITWIMDVAAVAVMIAVVLVANFMSVIHVVNVWVEI